MSNHDQPPMIVPPSSLGLLSSQPQPPMDYDTEMNRGWELRDYLHILLKRKWWIIWTFLSIFLVGALHTFIKTPIYRSATMLQITQDNPGSQVTVDDKLGRLTGSDSLEKFQQTQYKILKSWSLAQGVVRSLNLKENEFKSIREKNPDKTEAEVEDMIVNLIMDNLEVTPQKNTYLAEIAFESPDKLLAQRVANAVAEEYMNLSIDRRTESFALVRKWLDRQLQEMAGKVQAAQKKLFKFGQKTDIYTLDGKNDVVVQKFIDLGSLLTKAQAEKMAKKAQYEQIKARGPNAPLIVNHPLVASLRQQVVSQQGKVSALKKVLRGEHPDLQAERASLGELQSRLQAEVQRLQESIKADYEAANRTERLLSDSFSSQKEQMAKLQDNLSDFEILKRDAQTNEQLYQALLSRVKEASIASTMVPSNVTVIDHGRLPKKPFKPKTDRDLAVTMVMGLVLGVGLAFLVEHLDDSIKSIDDLERACNLASLGILPMQTHASQEKKTLNGEKLNWSMVGRYLPGFRRSDRSVAEDALDLVVYKHPNSGISEAIRHIYTSIMLSTSGRPPRAILITSPNPGEGKTMLASNLAQSYAQDERQVVLVDCDLRKPRLHKIFQVKSLPGLSNYLTGNAPLEEIICATSIPNLKIIPAGARPPNPATLFNSEIFKDLLIQLRQQFQHIIIDTPPILGFADARFISILVDGVLLITKFQQTHKSAGRLAHKFLSNAPILGSVLNCFVAYGLTYGNYYYQYNYKDYYKYNNEK